jgi:hypothetical protein
VAVLRFVRDQLAGSGVQAVLVHTESATVLRVGIHDVHVDLLAPSGLAETLATTGWLSRMVAHPAPLEPPAALRHLVLQAHPTLQ